LEIYTVVFEHHYNKTNNFGITAMFEYIQTRLVTYLKDKRNNATT